MIDMLFAAVGPWLLGMAGFICVVKVVRYVVRRIFWDR